MLVEEEDRHPGGVDQLIDLRTTGSQMSRCVAIARRLADPVCLVADQDVDPVGLCIAELVEELEERLDSRGSLAGHLA